MFQNSHLKAIFAIMEISELNSIGLPDIISESFCTHFSNQTGFFISLRSHIHVYKLLNSQLCDLQAFNAEASIIDCPEGIPTNQINLQLNDMFYHAPMEGRLELLLNNTLIPKLSSTGPATRLVSLDLSSDDGSDDNALVLALNNFGDLAIYAYQTTTDSRMLTYERKWVQIENVSTAWMHYLKSNTNLLEKFVSNYETLKTTANEIILSAMCWKDCSKDGNRYISCLTRSNVIVLSKLFRTEQQYLKLIMCQAFQSEPSAQMQSIKWISTSDNISLLIITCDDGKIILFSVTSDDSDSCKFEIKKLPDVWSDSDGIPVTKICTYLEKKAQVLFVLAIKTTHVLIFMVELKSQTFEILQFQSYNFDHYKIAGITQLTDMKFLICSPNCIAEIIEIQIENEFKFNMKITEVKLYIDSNTWRINGLESSRNKCLLFFTADIAVVSKI